METKQDLVYRIIEDRAFEKINKKRKEHFFRRYAPGYYELCNELGIEPEDKVLYEYGLAELMKKSF